MASQTPQELVEYYQNLLITQYNAKPKASGTIGASISPILMCETTVEVINFSDVATSGTFVLSYNDVATAAINWNDSANTIQSKLQAITGLESVTVTGSIASQVLTITFTDVIPPAYLLVVESNALMAGASLITISVSETDETLPLSVQNGFNLIEGTPIAQGAQLDIIGKYVGVSRSGNGFTSYITLDDEDYLSLIRMKIILNAAASDLATIQNFVHQFFAGEMLVFDNTHMQMTYYLSSTVGSNDLIQLFVTEGLLPAPMAVALLIFYAPVDVTKFFTLVTYQQPILINGTGVNTYQDYDMNSPMIDYRYFIAAP